MAEKELKDRVGLALSGGGSRAAAFHCGTLLGLEEVGATPEIDVVSSVSGGSVFAAAWMAALWRSSSVREFIDFMQGELKRGFVFRSLNWRAIKLVRPSYTRTNLLADTFDRVLMKGMTLKDLPEKPFLCLNNSVMETGQVGKFTKAGFSGTGISAPGGSIPMNDFPVALAAAASAAFPVGLPPVYLLRGKHLPAGTAGGNLALHKKLSLIDGGVLENLGVQTLFKSRRFPTWNMIISDAGQQEEPWKAGILDRARGTLIGAISSPIIERVIVMMNSKENRHMRLQTYQELLQSWLADSVRTNTRTPCMDEYLAEGKPFPRRRMIFVRLPQTFAQMLKDIPRWRLCELATRAGRTGPVVHPATEASLAALGVDLSAAKAIHSGMGGDAAVSELNGVVTQFTGLSEAHIKGLADHARWQVYAMRAIYWD